MNTIEISLVDEIASGDKRGFRDPENISLNLKRLDVLTRRSWRACTTAEGPLPPRPMRGWTGTSYDLYGLAQVLVMDVDGADTDVHEAARIFADRWHIIGMTQRLDPRHYRVVLLLTEAVDVERYKLTQSRLVSEHPFFNRHDNGFRGLRPFGDLVSVNLKGASVDPVAALPFHTSAIDTEEEPEHGPLADVDPRRHRHVVNALRATLPAISGQGGQSRLLRAACVVRNDFGCSERDSVQYLLRVYNPRCLPPWPRRNIEQKVREASRLAREGRHAFGYGTTNPTSSMWETRTVSRMVKACAEAWAPGTDDATSIEAIRPALKSFGWTDGLVDARGITVVRRLRHSLQPGRSKGARMLDHRLVAYLERVHLRFEGAELGRDAMLATIPRAQFVDPGASDRKRRTLLTDAMRHLGYTTNGKRGAALRYIPIQDEQKSPQREHNVNESLINRSPSLPSQNEASHVFTTTGSSDGDTFVSASRAKTFGEAMLRTARFGREGHEQTLGQLGAAHEVARRQRDDREEGHKDGQGLLGPPGRGRGGRQPALQKPLPLLLGQGPGAAEEAAEEGHTAPRHRRA